MIDFKNLNLNLSIHNYKNILNNRIGNLSYESIKSVRYYLEYWIHNFYAIEEEFLFYYYYK